jgi:hypothetical protein
LTSGLVDLNYSKLQTFGHGLRGLSNARVILGLAHKNYGHMAVMPDAVRAALAEDFG